MKTPIILVFLSVISLFSCRSTGFSQTGDLHPEYEGFVGIYFEEPEIEYAEIGIFTQIYKYMENDADQITEIQKKAAKLGANAIIVVETRDNPPTYHDHIGTTKITVKAIRLLENG